MPSIFRVDMNALLPSGEASVSSHFLGPGVGGTLATSVFAADLWMSTLAADPNFPGMFPSTLAFQAVKVSEIDEATGAVIATANGTETFPGTDIVGALPPQAGVVVSLGTAVSGASKRGRYYLPPMSVSVLAATGRLDSGVQADLLAAVTAAHAAEISVSGGQPLLVYSRKLHSVEPVVTLRIGDVIDTQRRRRDKLVENYVAASI